MPWISLGAAAIGAGGAALSGGGSGGTLKPWGPLRQPTTAAAKLIEQGLYRGGFQGDRVANMLPGQIQALNGMSAVGRNVQPLAQAGNQQLQQTLQGEFLDNPFTSDAVQAAFRPITQAYQQTTMPGILGRLAGTGNLNSSAGVNMMRQAQEGLGNAMADASARIGYQNYGDERNRQMGALGQIPGVMGAAYMPYDRQFQAGALSQNQQQQEINARMGAWNEPMQRALQAYSALGGSPYVPSGGGTGTGGAIGNALMGGLGGYQLGQYWQGQQQPPQAQQTQGPRSWVNGYW